MHSQESRRLLRRAHELIPGGCHTYAKGDDQFPQSAPGLIVRGEGCRIWDVDGNEYIEYGAGCRAVTLGHCFPPIVEAVQQALSIGTNFNRPAAIEVAAAEAFLRAVPRADMVKFCKNGSDATTAAIKLARAATGRSKIAFCVDHPFFSTDDWFIGTTPLDAGIPNSVKELSLPFHYNDIESIEKLLAAEDHDIAAIILEPVKYALPEQDFLTRLRDLCTLHNVVLIFDEMICGFRLSVSGGQGYFGVSPDLSTFGKALGNGFSISALAGKREFMKLGGLLHEDARVFLLSTTHGAECHSLAAMIATIRFYEENPVIEVLDRQGRRLKTGVQQVVQRHGLADHIHIVGMPCNLVFTTMDREGNRSQAFRSLLLQELLERGVFAPTFIVNYSHADEDIDATIDALDHALETYAMALDSDVSQFLRGAPSESPYRKFNAPWVHPEFSTVPNRPS